MALKDYNFWFVVGSQLLYGPETLAEVEKDAKIMVDGLQKSGKLPCNIILKGIMKGPDEIQKTIKEANADDTCAGIVTFCHTFSPSKMWINGLTLLQKPWLHFHTQFFQDIHNEEINMDYMNLHQSSHGDREHGFIGARMRIPRKVVVGYWQDEKAQESIGKWMRAAVGAAVSRCIKVMRFGDNMREVAVTEGDKVEAQIKLGWQVNTWPVGQLVETMNQVTDQEIDEMMNRYQEKYSITTDDIETVRYQAREEIAMKKMLDSEGCTAFSNTFQDLYGMKQLPGLATQDLMAQGYGYAGEGDWKTAAMTAIMKSMTEDMGQGTTFMEDYNYDFKKGISLGAHMLEVCPTIASGKAKIEVHDLGIGGKEAPARLVFENKPGKGIVVSLIDMGGRFRVIVQDIECIKPIQTMPNLPVARVMWYPAPSLAEGAHSWIIAGGAHHNTLSLDCDVEMIQDWARIMGLEFVHINKDTVATQLEQDLFIADFVWNAKK